MDNVKKVTDSTVGHSIDYNKDKISTKIFENTIFKYFNKVVSIKI